jgi:hypothetical protein
MRLPSRNNSRKSRNKPDVPSLSSKNRHGTLLLNSIIAKLRKLSMLSVEGQLNETRQLKCRSCRSSKRVAMSRSSKRLRFSTNLMMSCFRAIRTLKTKLILIKTSELQLILSVEIPLNIQVNSFRAILHA